MYMYMYIYIYVYVYIYICICICICIYICIKKGGPSGGGQAVARYWKRSRGPPLATSHVGARRNARGPKVLLCRQVADLAVASRPLMPCAISARTSRRVLAKRSCGRKN